jgi:hypothetical protein
VAAMVLSLRVGVGGRPGDGAGFIDIDIMSLIGESQESGA